MRNTIRYSELFTSFQGEAHRNGMPTLFFRFFGCNLKCDGFGQVHPTRKDTWILPYKEEAAWSNFSESKPVFSHGCDSSYSWNGKFKKYSHTETPEEIAAKIESMLQDNNYTRHWTHRRTLTDIQLCFTGGEPMLWQPEMISITNSLMERGSLPSYFTIETNTTRKIEQELVRFIEERAVHLACSPKLYNVSGEERGVDILTIQDYINTARTGSLKFVMNNRIGAWDELLRVVDKLHLKDGWDVWVMPVGATVESQDDESIALIAEKAISEGFYVAGRTHIQVFGNKVGK